MTRLALLLLTLLLAGPWLVARVLELFFAGMRWAG